MAEFKETWLSRLGTVGRVIGHLIVLSIIIGAIYSHQESVADYQERKPNNAFELGLLMQKSHPEELQKFSAQEVGERAIERNPEIASYLTSDSEPPNVLASLYLYKPVFPTEIIFGAVILAIIIEILRKTLVFIIYDKKRNIDEAKVE